MSPSHPPDRPQRLILKLRAHELADAAAARVNCRDDAHQRLIAQRCPQPEAGLLLGGVLGLDDGQDQVEEASLEQLAQSEQAVRDRVREHQLTCPAGAGHRDNRPDRSLQPATSVAAADLDAPLTLSSGRLEHLLIVLARQDPAPVRHGGGGHRRQQ